MWPYLEIWFLHVQLVNSDKVILDHGIMVAPESNDWCKKAVCDGGRDWSDVSSISQGMPRISGSHQKLEEARSDSSLEPSSLEPSDGTQPGWYLDFGLPSLQNCERISFCGFLAFQLVVLCYSRPRNPLQKLRIGVFYEEDDGLSGILLVVGVNKMRTGQGLLELLMRKSLMTLPGMASVRYVRWTSKWNRLRSKRRVRKSRQRL